MAAMILLTGASGYIGSRLLRVLEEGGCAVRCLARRPERIAAGRATTEVVSGDCLDEASLLAAMDGVDLAYYLVHSMASGPGFAALDRQAAANFGRAAARAGVRRVVYLGGLGDDPHSLSTHLKSRLETGEALREAGVPVVEFRASIVIGAGSLSFEMIRALVERLPVMICPRWVNTRTQPIAIDDVLAYLRAALDLPDGRGAVFEIGGPEVVSYGEMMREYARLRRLRRLLIPVPVLTPRLSGLWLGLVTPAQARVGRALVEGLRNPTVVHSPAARETFEIEPMPLRQAFVRAIEEDAANQQQIDTRLIVVDAPPAQAFAPIRRIGGSTGWYFGDALWRLRGWLDSFLGGAGMPRHRRDPDACGVGDVIDGWRVEAYEPDRLLRLAAGLKLPGRGWLEFRVSPLGDGERSLIRQTATFDPRGVAGRLYWYGVLPVHALIFRGLLRRIARRAVPLTAPAHLSTFPIARSSARRRPRCSAGTSSQERSQRWLPRRWCESSSSWAASATAGVSRCRSASARRVSAGWYGIAGTYPAGGFATSRYRDRSRSGGMCICFSRWARPRRCTRIASSSPPAAACPTDSRRPCSARCSRWPSRTAIASCRPASAAHAARSRAGGRRRRSRSPPRRRCRRRPPPHRWPGRCAPFRSSTWIDMWATGSRLHGYPIGFSDSASAMCAPAMPAGPTAGSTSSTNAAPTIAEFRRVGSHGSSMIARSLG